MELCKDTPVKFIEPDILVLYDPCDYYSENVFKKYSEFIPKNFGPVDNKGA